MKLLWLDLETTGYKTFFDRILEIGIIYDDGTNIVEFHKYIKHSSYPVGFEQSQAIHGITKEFLEKNGEDEDLVYRELVKFLDRYVDKFNSNDKMLLCGYNVAFDDRFLRELFKRYGNKFYGSYFMVSKLDILSILALMIALGKYDAGGSQKLEDVAEDFGIKFKPHKGIEDIRATRSLYSRMLNLLKD